MEHLSETTCALPMQTHCFMCTVCSTGSILYPLTVKLSVGNSFQLHYKCIWYSECIYEPAMTLACPAGLTHISYIYSFCVYSYAQCNQNVHKPTNHKQNHPHHSRCQKLSLVFGYVHIHTVKFLSETRGNFKLRCPVQEFEGIFKGNVQAYRLFNPFL